MWWGRRKRRRKKRQASPRASASLRRCHLVSRRQRPWVEIWFVMPSCSPFFAEHDAIAVALRQLQTCHHPQAFQLAGRHANSEFVGSTGGNAVFALCCKGRQVGGQEGVTHFVYGRGCDGGSGVADVDETGPAKVLRATVIRGVDYTLGFMGAATTGVHRVCLCT